MKYRQMMALGLSALLSVSGVGSQGRVYAENAEAVAASEDKQEDTSQPPAPETPAATEPPAETQKPTEPPTETQKPTEPPTETQPPTEAPTESQPSEDTTEAQAPEETAPPAETELISDAPGTEVPSGTEGDAESETGMSETLTEGETESETETELDEEGLIEEETEEETEEEEHITNEQLIARQNIVIPPDIALEFRFVQVDKVYAVVKNPNGAAIREEQEESSAVVGTLAEGGLCYILENAGAEWIYVESGSVRGFIFADDIETGEAAEAAVKKNGEEDMELAVSRMQYSENDAMTYTHTTVYPVIADKVYGIARKNLNIYEEKRDSARVTGTLEEDGLCYILADAQKEWIFVESGDARGFVRAGELLAGVEAVEKVMEAGELSMTLADVKIQPEENKGCYYTLTSVREASRNNLLRSDMVNFAFQFLGNPYVWGGTSLTNGCDCSGFTQSIYAHFGYSIPRVAEAQAVCAMQIPVSEAAPGDLIFYARNGYVYHVSMYIGGGQVIHAAGTRVGIIISGIGSSAVWAVRII